MSKSETEKAAIRDDKISTSSSAGAGVGEDIETPVKRQNPERDANIRLADEDMNLDLILDIPVTISVEIGNTKINIRDLLQLNQGSVIKLERMAGEPLDIKVNGTLIAHGEVVVVNDKYGIRLTDVISPTERVKKLR